MRERNCKTHNCNRWGIGAILVIVGSVLLAANLELFSREIFNVIWSWPMILVVVGLVHLTKKNFVPATMLLLIGGFFMLPRLFPGIASGEMVKFWPVLLIAGGILFVFKRNKKLPNLKSLDVSDGEVIDVVNVFGGGERIVDSQNFKGGQITNVFGGGEITFANAQMAPEGATIEFISVFGGSSVIVPSDWNVRVVVTSVFGGFSDKRIVINDKVDTSKTLTIKGVAVFGGGELRNGVKR